MQQLLQSLTGPLGQVPFLIAFGPLAFLRRIDPEQADRVISCKAVLPDRLRSLDITGIRMVCASYLDAEGLAHARYLIRRLRRKLPQAKILVGFSTMTEDDASRRDPIVGTGADLSALTLQQAIAQVCRTAAEEQTDVNVASGQLVAAE